MNSFEDSSYWERETMLINLGWVNCGDDMICPTCCARVKRFLVGSDGYDHFEGAWKHQEWHYALEWAVREDKDSES